MLFCTSLVALVGAAENQPSNSPRKLQIVNTKRQSTICELIFPTSVLAVKMNRKRLVVVLETEIYIYDISTMKLLHTIETGPNPNGEYGSDVAPRPVTTDTRGKEGATADPLSRRRPLVVVGTLVPRLSLPGRFRIRTSVFLVRPLRPTRSNNRRRPPL
jgi:hypothetical protein